MILFFFNDTATTEIYTLSLHDALPILSSRMRARVGFFWQARHSQIYPELARLEEGGLVTHHVVEQSDRPDKKRSEEHTSELQSRQYLVCRLLLEKKKILLYYPSPFLYP